MNAYDEAVIRQQAARDTWTAARQALADAERELEDAEAALRACESRPGIPLPEYR